MDAMTSIERFSNFLRRKPLDRIPVTVDFDVYKYFVDRGREIGTYAK